MENQKIFQKDGKSKKIPKGWKIEKSSRRMENQKSSRRMENKKSSNRMENCKIFQKDGKSILHLDTKFGKSPDTSATPASFRACFV